MKCYLFKKTEGKVVFITDDKDFRSTRKVEELHLDLKNDLINHGFESDDVIICRSLDLFVKKYINPELERLDVLKEEIASGKCAYFDVEKFFDDNFSAIEKKVSEALSSQADDDRELSLSGLYSPHDFDVTNVFKLTDTKSLVELAIEVEFFIPKHDAYALPDESRIRVYNWAWNDYVVRAGTTDTITINIDIVLEDDKINDFDVTSLDTHLLAKEIRVYFRSEVF